MAAQIWAYGNVIICQPAGPLNNEYIYIYISMHMVYPKIPFCDDFPNSFGVRPGPTSKVSLDFFDFFLLCKAPYFTPTAERSGQSSVVRRVTIAATSDSAIANKHFACF